MGIYIQWHGYPTPSPLFWGHGEWQPNPPACCPQAPVLHHCFLHLMSGEFPSAFVFNQLLIKTFALIAPDEVQRGPTYFQFPFFNSFNWEKQWDGDPASSWLLSRGNRGLFRAIFHPFYRAVSHCPKKWAAPLTVSPNPCRVCKTAGGALKQAEGKHHLLAARAAFPLASP